MNKKGYHFFQKLKIPDQFKYLFLLYLSLVLYFAVFRLIFHVSFSDQFYDNVTFSQIITSYLIGFRFDQIVILALLTPLLLVLPWFDFQNKIVKLYIAFFCYIICPIIFLGLLADIRFYDYFNIRLNFMAYEYTGEGNLSSDLINADRFFWEFISIWIAISISFIYLHYRLLQNCVTNYKYNLKSRLIWFVCFLLLFAGGIRGRISLAPMNWGIAYFSDNHTLNQSALNGIYTLIKNFSETNHDPRLSFLDESERFPFIEQKTALTKVQQILSQQNVEFIDKSNSLKRSMTPSSHFNFQPNIIIVLMESWQGSRTSSLGGTNNLTPHFDSLTQHGILFENFYANGFRTNFGLGATLCSYPTLPGSSILKRYKAQHPFRTLSEILHEKGYYNLFCYGGDLAFDNMEGFFRTKKYDKFYGEETFDSDDLFSKWGIPDQILFHKINQIVDSLPRPFQLSTLTISNHEPFDIPDSSLIRYHDDTFDSQKKNSMIYADYAIGQFMKTMQSKPLFDSTIFLFVSDHSLFESSNMSMDPNIFHIPLLIYSPKLLGDTAVKIKRIGSQVDVIPTLLGLLGDNFQIESWGRDLLHLPANDSGYVILSLGDRIGYLNNDYFYFEQLGIYAKLYANQNKTFTEVDTTDNASTLSYLRERLHNYTQLADQMTLIVPLEK